MSDAVIQRGIALVGDGLCPACDVTGHEVRLQASPPDGFHYHGSNTAAPTRLFCPNDGQGYRLNDAGELRITVPCNGGLHPDGTVGPAPTPQEDDG